MSARFLSLLIALIFLFSDVKAQLIRITPNELDFGNVAVDSIAGLEFTLENTDDESYPSVEIFPIDPEHFSLNWTGERAEAVRVMDAIREICDAILMYSLDFGEQPAAVEELIERGYLEIPDSVMRNWDFSFVGRNPIVQIEAVSTEEMPDGEGRVILFDLETGDFHGYGTPIGDPQAPLRAMETIGSIQNAIIMYNQDYGEDPGSVSLLMELFYLLIPEYILRKWNFRLIGANPIREIEAVSTAEMAGGMGHVIRYDIQADSFSGYRLPYHEFFDLLWGGNWEHGTLTLSVSFQPDEERQYSSEIFIIVSGLEGDPDTLHIPLDGNGVLSVSEPPDVPVGFFLLPAYPNPFNSTTTIRYRLPVGSNLSLKLIDSLGRSLTTVLEGYKHPGVHTFTLSATYLPSGLYFVRLEVSGQQFSRNVTLIK